jgi:glycosyltransferase involved in cell wall biosynthesis
LALITFGPPAAKAPPEPLETACRRIVMVPPPHRPPSRRLVDLVTGKADLAERLWSPAFASALSDVLAQFEPDVVQIEGLELAAYLPVVRAGAPAARVVYDAHNAEVVLQRRALATDRLRPRRWPAALYSASQIPRIARLEARTLRAVDAVLCVSSEDAAALCRLAPGLSPVIVPNGITLSDYAGVAPSGAPPGVDVLVFTGKMDYRPNVDAALWFAGEILPRVRAARPAAEFHIVGQSPPPVLRRRRAQAGVVVTGAVADALPHIAGAAVYVAPLRMGGGTRFKLLEAFALARPVVSTTLGAEGFSVASERELLLADTAPAFAAGILRLLANPALAAHLAGAGQRFARAGYDWTAIIPRLQAVYGRLLRQTQ